MTRTEGILSLRKSDIIELKVDSQYQAIGIVGSIDPEKDTVLFSKFDMLNSRTGRFSGLVSNVEIKYDINRFTKIDTRELFTDIYGFTAHFNFKISDVFSTGDYIIISKGFRRETNLLGKILSIDDSSLMTIGNIKVLDPKTGELDFSKYKPSDIIQMYHRRDSLIELARPDLIQLLELAELNPLYTIGGHLV